jgi:ribonuclease HII
MYIVGIDEAGRGPLAGPVAVGAVLVPTEFDWALVPGVGDSKQLSPGARLKVFARAQQLQYARQLRYAVALVGAEVIDTYGISFAIETALARTLHRLGLLPQGLTPTEAAGVLLPSQETTVKIKLDGGLRAPGCFAEQETIIKGDATEPVIGLASIMAKVTRDQYMERIARRYPHYGFAEHMGYGTKVHRAAIAKRGLTPIHRASYCQNAKVWGKV